MTAADFQQEKSQNAEEEIRALERTLEEKKRVLAEARKEIPPEKELLREALRERIEAVRPSTSPALPSPVPFGAGGAVTPQQVPQGHVQEEEVRALIDIALTRSIEDAVKAAQEKSPYLLDELHDHLVDEYYDKLVALRKITL